MKRSTVIAHCMVNSGFMRTLSDAEQAVSGVFAECFPGRDFSRWNKEMPDDAAERVVRTVGRASRINVEYFIVDLSEGEIPDPPGRR